jgi:HSP20 family protein
MTMMIRRNPWHRVVRYNNFADEAARDGGSRIYRLAVDAYDTEDAVVILASVPGLNPEDIHINLEDDVLTVEGEFKNPVEDVNYIIRERAAEGHFQRSLRLNVPVEVENIEAVFDNGILTLTLPKAAEARPLTIPVKSVSNN